jgi:ABC-type polysaccharide/polyol phosphate transport system ATPase subunit
MKAISVRNLTKDYRIYSQRGQKFKELITLNRRQFHEAKRALHDISFDVDPGECIGVIGDNGSGKSTLLKILAGTTAPTAGDIEIGGKVSYLLDPATGFNPEFSGRENVHIKCALLGLAPPQTNELFDVVHDFSGLGERIDHPMKTYSAGMVVRLGFAVAIHVPFDVLLIDEVLSVGDYLFQRKCVAAIRAFKDHGKTIMVSSHSLSDVATFCDRLILLNQGKMAMIGGTDAVVQAYVRDCDRRFTSIEEARVPIHDQALACCVDTLGKAAILAVHFIDAEGKETTHFTSGTGLTVRVRFLAEEEIVNPCIRIQFLRNDGMLVLGSNTYRHGIDLGRVKGLCHFPSINILEGDYYVNVGIWPDEYQSFVAKTPYDVHEYRYIVNIESERPHGGGLVLSPSQWTLNRLEDFK